MNRITKGINKTFGILSIVIILLIGCQSKELDYCKMLELDQSYVNMDTTDMAKSSCKPPVPSEFSDLTEMSYDDLKICLLGNHYDENPNLIYIDSMYHQIAFESVKSIVADNPSTYFLQPLQDQNGEVKCVQIRLATKEDKSFMAELHTLLNADPEVFVRVIDCNSIRKKLADVLIKDSNDRFSMPKSMRDSIDHSNLSTVISIIENCGLPTVNDVGEDGVLAIFLTLQHSSYRYMKEYFHVVEELVRRGDLDIRQQVIMEDRILMYEGLPQKYGSQFQGADLYQVDNMDSVVQRRKQLGMMPIEQYKKLILSKE